MRDIKSAFAEDDDKVSSNEVQDVLKAIERLRN